LYQPFQDSDVYFISTACGRPQGGVDGPAPVDACAWTGESKTWFFWGRHKWMAP